MKKNRAQSTIEFVVLLIIVIGSFIAMQWYVKRGLQGRWKSAVDDLGDQYDPRLVNSLVTDTLSSNAITEIRVVRDQGGFVTNRMDQSNAVETHSGVMVVGGEE